MASSEVSSVIGPGSCARLIERLERQAEQRFMAEARANCDVVPAVPA